MDRFDDRDLDESRTMGSISDRWSYDDNGNTEAEQIQSYVWQNDVISFGIGIFVGLIITRIVTLKSLLSNGKEIRCPATQRQPSALDRLFMLPKKKRHDDRKDQDDTIENSCGQWVTCSMSRIFDRCFGIMFTSERHDPIAR